MESDFVQACSRGQISTLLFSQLQSRYPRVSEAFATPIPFPTDLMDPDVQQLRAKSRGFSLEYAHALVEFSSDCKVSFTNDVLGPKVTWAVILLDFASRFPDLPEWQVTQNLHRRVCQFRSRFQRLTVLKCVQVTGFKHANSLQDFHLRRLSGFCGSFNPSSPLRVWFSLIKFSLEICSGTPKHLISLDFDSLRGCPLAPLSP